MNVIKSFLGEKEYDWLKNLCKRFWYTPIFLAYYLTNNWVLGNLILLYIGFKAGVFWVEYYPRIKAQGEAMKLAWGLNKKDGFLHEDDSGSPKGYT